VALLAGPLFTAPAQPDDAAVRAIVYQVLGAWRDGNARDMAEVYERTGNFVNPNGVRAVGRANIKAYYAAAFAAGYAGSALAVDILHSRHLTPAVIHLGWYLSYRPGRIRGTECMDDLEPFCSRVSKDYCMAFGGLKRCRPRVGSCR
jgi:uncharacterized protein (TIGR02246 family)